LPPGTGHSLLVCVLVDGNGCYPPSGSPTQTSFSFAAPTVSSVFSASGPTLGGVTVQVSGSGFGTSSKDVSVSVGGSTVTTSVQVISDQQLNFTLPAGIGNLTVGVIVSGQSSTNKESFLYDGPEVDLIAPTSGLIGSQLHIFGKNFSPFSCSFCLLPSVNVSVGDAICTNVTQITPGHLSCTTPPGLPAGKGYPVYVSVAERSSTNSPTFSVVSGGGGPTPPPPGPPASSAKTIPFVLGLGVGIGLAVFLLIVGLIVGIILGKRSVKKHMYEAVN